LYYVGCFAVLLAEMQNFPVNSLIIGLVQEMAGMWDLLNFMLILCGKARILYAVDWTILQHRQILL